VSVTLWQVVAGVLVAIIGAAATYLGIRRRVMTELEGRYDAELRALRLASYATLWSAMEPLARYAREPAGFPTRSALETMSKTFRHWYFTDGGLYLATETREAYFEFQSALAAVVTSDRWGELETRQIDEHTFEALRDVASWLRTTLTYDVGTRRRFSLAPEWIGERGAGAGAAKRSREARRDAIEAGTAVRDEWSAARERRGGA